MSSIIALPLIQYYEQLTQTVASLQAEKATVASELSLVETSIAQIRSQRQEVVTVMEKLKSILPVVQVVAKVQPAIPSPPPKVSRKWGDWAEEEPDL